MKPRVEICADAAALANRGAELIETLSRLAIARSNIFSVGLSGGSTPKRLYETLASTNAEFRDQLSWDQTHFFWTDERHVGPDDPDSNYGMVNEAMLAHVPVPASNVHRMKSENPNAQEVADDYEAELKTFFKIKSGEWPRLDLVLLGLGTDGHTASIFPGSEVLLETSRLVAAPWVAKFNTHRLTMTLPVLNNASDVVFLVSGNEKAEILRDVLKGQPNQFPAQTINPYTGNLTWLIDQAAASKL